MAEGNGNGNGTAQKQLMLSERTMWATVGSTGLAFFLACCALLWRANSAYDSARALGVRVAALESAMIADRTEITKLEANQVEIETQFRGTGQVIDLMHANDLRVQAMLWQKAFGSTYPTDNAYYPDLSRQPGAAQ